jgi:hypothetical protein
MRINNEMPDVLVVKESPLGLGAIILVTTGIIGLGLYQNWAELHWFLRLFLSAFITLLWLIFFRLAINVTARFDRRVGRIEIVRTGLFGESVQNYRFQDFVQARVQESNDCDGSTFRLVFVFSKGAPPLRDSMLSKTDIFGLSPNEIPFTAHLSGGDGGPKRAAATINAWAGRALA